MKNQNISNDFVAYVLKFFDDHKMNTVEIARNVIELNYAVTRGVVDALIEMSQGEEDE